jgi:hypothetical protein
MNRSLKDRGALIQDNGQIRVFRSAIPIRELNWCFADARSGRRCQGKDEEEEGNPHGSLNQQGPFLLNGGISVIGGLSLGECAGKARQRVSPLFLYRSTIRPFFDSTSLSGR